MKALIATVLMMGLMAQTASAAAIVCASKLQLSHCASR